MLKIARKINSNKEKSDDVKISIALMSSFVVLTFQYFILIYFNLLDTSNGSRVQLISKVLVGIIFMYALPIVFKKSKFQLISVYFIAIFIFLLNIILFPENYNYIKGLIFPFFFMSLPSYIYTVSLNDLSILKQIMKKASLIIFTFGFILGILIFSGRASVGTYSMSLSYYMLLPTIIFINELFERFTLRRFIVVLISMTIILALGSRGAILCLAVFILLKLVKPNTKLTYKKIFLYFIFIGMLSLIFVNFNNILFNVYNTLLKYGINSRSILLFLNEKFYLSGRENIFHNTLDEISKNSILGIGIGGDRRVNGGYAHNLFIEVLANFGVFIGLIISILLILLILKSLIVKKNEVYIMIITWLSLGFVSLMMSGSYFTDISFWILMGIMMNSLNHKYDNQSNL